MSSNTEKTTQYIQNHLEQLQLEDLEMRSAEVNNTFESIYHLYPVITVFIITVITGFVINYFVYLYSYKNIQFTVKGVILRSLVASIFIAISTLFIVLAITPFIKIIQSQSGFSFKSLVFPFFVLIISIIFQWLFINHAKKK